ncbi:alpha/beta hydrolase [Alteriqipengyuania lutimaris]|nr:alpha/beta hydrolase [Alteriqipengyuania lutimaris]MBB3035351.1 pimeloyl-ACP methyl ester carboxylesterase [Alteriqipengyuania lutimaris]
MVAQQAAPDQAGSAALPSARHVALPVGGRTLDLSVFDAVGEPAAAIFLSHGAGSSPERLAPLIGALQEAGFVVLAPRHGDSLTIPEAEREDIRAAFISRTADLNAVSAYAAELHPGLALAGVGHSYGSLIALMGGGALDPMFGARVPAMKAVVMFSSPGPIPGLTGTPGAYDTVAVPTLTITGPQDVAQPFAGDPQVQVAQFEALPEGDHTLLLVEGSDHSFVYGEEDGYDEAIALVTRFLLAKVAGDAEAAKRFDEARSSERIEIRRR